MANRATRWAYLGGKCDRCGAPAIARDDGGHERFCGRCNSHYALIFGGAILAVVALGVARVLVEVL